ncbi:MAG: hypothetical protein ACI974_001157, partial [Paraglaciecola sp.]
KIVLRTRKILFSSAFLRENNLKQNKFLNNSLTE